MRNQPNRLVPGSHALQGSAIDRAKPITFKLDGRIIDGLDGDTVLSAVLASGIDTAGKRKGATIGLAPQQAPEVALASTRTGWVPMARLPALDGAEYVTHAPKRSALFPFSAARRRSLNLDLDQPAASEQSRHPGQDETASQVDLVVVGGGVAGMSAALAGAKRGLRTLLVDAAQALGGRSRLFGNQDGEEATEETIQRLAAAVEASSDIEVMRQAEVFAIQPGAVRLHQVVVENGEAAGRVIVIHAARIVLATGALERLPIFAGNRLPGVWGGMDSYELARLYGVWPGRSALIATGSNPVYRLAMFARDAGIAVPRILDPRLQPQSRFIEFSKAYGITLAPGTIVGSVAPARERGLQVSTEGAVDGGDRGEPLLVDRLVVNGGWQPDLTLWHMAGGHSTWSTLRNRLEPLQAPSGIVLAGSAAGWMGQQACLLSGSDAVDALLNRPRRPIAENAINPAYETPDAPAWIGHRAGTPVSPAFLDAGSDQAIGASRPRLFSPKRQGWSLADTTHPLTIGDIAAAVQLGATPGASAGIVAQERIAMVLMGDRPTGGTVEENAPLPLPPAFLAGRYPGATLWLSKPDEARRLDIGALVFSNADKTNPLEAIGVVVSMLDGQAVVLAVGTAGQAIIIREGERPVSARLEAPYAPEKALGAALGGGTSAA